MSEPILSSLPEYASSMISHRDFTASFRFLILALLPGLPAWGNEAPRTVGTTFPTYVVADTAAPEVTKDNLVAGERFWPYLVTLNEGLRLLGREQELSAGLSGVLIRIEAGGLARLDFGRDGSVLVPVEKTDLIAQANKIRLGEETKIAPNFLYAIGARLVDSGADRLFPLGLDVSSGKVAYLCVFAPFEGEDLDYIAAELKRLPARADVMIILFPTGDFHDAKVRERLRALNWTVPFVYDHLAEAYTRTLLPEGRQQPAVMLISAEGRILFESQWEGAMLEKLTQAQAERVVPLPPAALLRR
jgi:hypothetical protein